MAHTVAHDEVLIEDGNTVQTGHIDTYGYLVSGFVLPAEFDGTTITFQAAAIDGRGSPGTFYPVHDSSGTEMTVTCAASRVVLIEPQTFAGARFLKIVAGTEQTGDTRLMAMKHREG